VNGEVPLARPGFGPEETEAVSQVLDSGWVSQGPRVEAFEHGLAELLGCETVTAVNSGTSALMLALRGLDIGAGDSVVVPAFGCAATALPVVETGARLLFAEVDPATFNVTWDTISRALEADTRAVIVVHMFGQVSDIETIAAECKRRNLLLIEDAALALGARRANRFAGTFGVAGCFSFHPRKILTTGEGGAVCTDDTELAVRIRAARNYGAAQTAWARFQTGDGSPRGFSRLAFNCKLTDLQAAVGLVQLRKLSGFIERRREIAARYSRSLSGCRNLRLPVIPAAALDHVFQAYVCTWMPDSLADIARDPVPLAEAESSLRRFKQTLTQTGIAVSDAAQFLPGLPVFGGQTLPGAWPVAQAVARLTFAIPIFPAMTEAQIDRVIQTVQVASQHC
jgi:perosamine synthetase